MKMILCALTVLHSNKVNKEDQKKKNCTVK